MPTRIGLQTFTIRRHLKSPGAIDGAFAKIAAMGIETIELAYVKLGQEYIEALQQAGRRHDIAIDSTQLTFRFLDRERERVAKIHERLDCRHTAVSVLPWKVIRGGRDHMLAFAEAVEALGKWYRERGIQLSFHHHDYEFRRYGETTGLEVLLQNTSSENVGLELDTYWTQRGGRSPQDAIRDLDGRVKVVHLRDYTIRPRYFELLPSDTELGAGNLDLTRIVDACCDKQVHLLAIEQNTRTPLQSVQRSVEHLRALGYSNLLRPTAPEAGHDTRQL